MVAVLLLSPLLSRAGEQRWLIMVPTDQAMEAVSRRFVRVGSPFKRQGYLFSRIITPAGPGLVCRTVAGLANSSTLCATGLREGAATHFISVGVAGGLGTNMAPGDLVLVAAVARHDAGNGSPGAQPVYGDYVTSNLCVLVATKAHERKVALSSGVLVSGDQFIADTSERSHLATAFAADIVDMNGSALVEACNQAEIPVCMFRIVSDRADESAPVDFQEFLQSHDAIDRALDVILASLEQMRAPLP
jgi:adenosylhomocysteine/aminodeoxyfutalosine nucleosidase